MAAVIRGRHSVGSISRPSRLCCGGPDVVVAAGKREQPEASRSVGCFAQNGVALAPMVDSGLNSYAIVAIPTQSLDAADCVGAASPGSVGSVALKSPGHATGPGTAPLIVPECPLRDQVIRGTPSIGYYAAEDADGIEPGRLLRCAVLSRKQHGEE